MKFFPVKKNYLKVQFMSIFFAFVVVINLVLMAPTAHAQFWGTTNIFSDFMMNVIETIQHQIEGSILGTLKVAAINVLNSQVANLVGGTSVGDALFITDWYDFLYTRPASQVALYMNDFYTLTTQGKASSANYQGAGDVDGASGNYASYLVAAAQQATNDDNTDEEDADGYYDLDSVVESPDVLFGQGSFRGLSALIGNPYNNFYGYTLKAQERFSSLLSREQDLARTEAQSSGFLGKKENGKVIAPAATIQGMVTNVQNIGNNLIAAAENPGEFLTGVVGAVVNRTVSNLIQKGVGQVQSAIQREINRVDKQVLGALDQANKALGPAAKFTKQWSQRTDVYIKPYTVPPPPPRECSSLGNC